MKFQATIKLKDDLKNIQKLFQAEEKNFKHKRSKYLLKKTNNELVFEIEAKDATALRSTLDSIAKTLKIYEDMKEIK